MSNDTTDKICLQVRTGVCNYRKETVVRVSKQGAKYVETFKRDVETRIGSKRLSSGEYLVLKTGEIKTYEKRDSKYDESLKKTFAKLRALIRTNFTGDSDNQLFITLTYKENMTDCKQLYVDFNKFMKRMKYRYADNKFEYITVAEPQGRGAWHMHLMLKCVNRPVLYLPNTDVADIWGKGYTATERLRSDDVGAYYVAYFTDILDETLAKKTGNSKARKKGERLKYYPKGFRFYRCSRGVKKPDEEYVSYGEIVKEYGNPVYSSVTDIVREGDGKVLNTIHKTVHKIK